MQRLACLLLAVLVGCAPIPLTPLTPAEERKLQAQIMAHDLCGEDRTTRCYKQAIRWYTKLDKKYRNKKCPGSTSTP